MIDKKLGFENELLSFIRHYVVIIIHVCICGKQIYAYAYYICRIEYINVSIMT